MLAASPFAPASLGARAAHAVPSVATVLTPDERLRVDAAGHGLYATLHRESVDEVVRDLRTRPVAAVLVSAASIARAGGGAVSRVAELVREFPGVPTVALVSELDAVPHAVLALGRSGVRTLVDARRPDGWRTLRATLAADDGRATIARRAMAALHDDLAGAPPACVHFFVLLFTVPTTCATVRALADHLDVPPTTLTSRFFRHALPAPRRYLSMARLVRMAALLETRAISLSTAADRLDYSSSQSFGRHVRTLLGVSAAEFRRTYDGDTMLRRFRDELVLPHRAALRTFSPFV